MLLSHNFQRLFQVNKIALPRNFQPVKPKQPTYLEIGAGKGMHALAFARQNPQAQLIAIERTQTKFIAFNKQLNQITLPNLIAVHADAVAWCVHGLVANSLAGVFLLYPNPEPHNANQRWLNMPFFEFLLSRMQPKARVILASNIQSYIQEAATQAQQVWHLPMAITQVAPTSQRTHFEVKYLARKETCWQLTITKPIGYITRFDSDNG